MEFDNALPVIDATVGPSDRLRIRTGNLARTQREDLDSSLTQREPDELFEPIERADPSEPIGRH